MHGHAFNPHSNLMGQLHYLSWFLEEKSAEGLLYYCSRLAPWPDSLQSVMALGIGVATKM